MCLKLSRPSCNLIKGIHETEIIPMEFMSFYNDSACRIGRSRASLTKTVLIQKSLKPVTAFKQTKQFLCNTNSS